MRWRITSHLILIYTVCTLFALVFRAERVNLAQHKVCLMSFVQSIALDEASFSTKMYLYFSYCSMKTYVVGTH